MFANKYLQKKKGNDLIEKIPDKNLGIGIVIPCFSEPDILKTLDSLLTCKMPECSTEVIILINYAETATEETKEFNRKTKNEVENWIQNNPKTGIYFNAIGPVELSKKWAGAGLARKTGMDETIRRFNMLRKPEGVVVSLDADTLVADNYLLEIEKHFKNNPKNIGATISFQHQTAELAEKHLKGIQLYEKYLEYYKRALEFSGYPYSMFTVGSAFAVTAEAYVKRGGMNRRQAGEDFYFLQNLVHMGTVGEINETKVFPSARLSNRVPFGTGPILQKWMNGEEDLNLTFNFFAFLDLKEFFDKRDFFFKMDEKVFNNLVNQLPDSIKVFLQKDKFWSEIMELNNNCSTLKSFQLRFFQQFNAFKILKYLNFAHDNFYKKVDLNEQICILNEKTK